MKSSVREYAILYVGKGKTESQTAGGGNVVLNAGQHALDGPEHTGQLPADRVSIEDVGAYYIGTDVEAALQEVGADLAALTPTGTAYTVEVQAPQSKRYLMEDGTFRNPLTTGDGVLSVGSISTIVDDTKYNAWPSIARLHDGRLILVYTKGDSHHADNTGKAVGRIGTEGLAGAITWGSEFTIYDDASVWVSATGVAVLSTGRIIVSGFYGAYTTDPLDGAFVTYSDDDGATWSSIVVVNSTLTSYSYGSGRVLELPNGDLLQCVEGKNSGDTFGRMVVLKSTDHGATWGSQVTIATGTRNYYEACLGLLDNDTVLVLLRTTDASGDIYSSTSTDGGATWSTPALAFAGHGQPNWIQLSTGTVIAITRENDGSLQGDVWAYTSTNRGSSWSSATTLDGTMYEMEYGSPIELLDGRVLVVYGYQPSSALTNSDIKQVYVTEGNSTITGSSGTVTSVALTVPAEFSVSGSPITTSGTLAVTKANESANTVWAGPTTGSAAAPTFRALVAADIPAGIASGPTHVHVAYETHTSNGVTTTFTMDQVYDPGSVTAWNRTTGVRLGVTEVLPDQVTISAAGTAADLLDFDYAASTI